MEQFLVKAPGSKAALAEAAATTANSIAASAKARLAAQLEEANRTIFGNERFRPRQLDIVQAIMRGEDVFVVMPTGGGKSLCKFDFLRILTTDVHHRVDGVTKNRLR